MGRAEVGGQVPLLLSRHRTSSEIYPAGARELMIFKESGCRLSILTHEFDEAVKQAKESLEIAAGHRWNSIVGQLKLDEAGKPFSGAYGMMFFTWRLFLAAVRSGGNP